MRRTVCFLLVVVMVLCTWVPPAAAGVGEDIKYPPKNKPELVLKGIGNPLKIAVGDRGEVYILDGLVVKKWENGKLTRVADMLSSKDYFAPYGLDDPEDLLTFRPGDMVYTQGALYICGPIVDRYPTPKPWGENWVTLGQAMYMIVKITDHFEPFIVDDYAKIDLHLPRSDYDLLIKGSTNEIDNNPYYQDWINRFSNFVTVPNLLLGNDGCLYVTKNTATKYSALFKEIIYTDRRWGTFKEEHKDNKFYMEALTKYESTRCDNIRGVYRIHLDGRVEMLDEGVHRIDSPKDVDHVSWFLGYNKYMFGSNSPKMAMTMEYVIPTNDPDVVLVTNGHWMHRYNTVTFQHERFQAYPGNEWPSLKGGTVFMPDVYFSVTYPRLTRDLGVMFFGNGAIWRLYEFKYYQDLSYAIEIPASIYDMLDWRFDEDRRLVYWLQSDGCLYRVSIANVLPTKRTTLASDLPFRVKYDFEHKTTYGSGDTYGVPYTRDGKTYVPVDAVLKALNLRGEIGNDFKKTDKQYVLPVVNPLTSLETKVVVEVLPRGQLCTLYVDIDDFLARIYEITGQRYTWSYDPPTNILYIKPTAETLPLFNWWW